MHSEAQRADTASEIGVAGRSLDLDRRAIREMDRLDEFIVLWLEHGEGGGYSGCGGGGLSSTGQEASRWRAQRIIASSILIADLLADLLSNLLAYLLDYLLTY